MHADQVAIVECGHIADAGGGQRPGEHERVIATARQMEVQGREVKQSREGLPDEAKHAPDEDDLKDVVRVVMRAQARVAEVTPEARDGDVQRGCHVEPWCQLDGATTGRDAAMEERRRDHLQEDDADDSLRDQPRVAHHARPVHHGCSRWPTNLLTIE